MIKISVSKQSNYPVSSIGIKKKLREFLEEKGIVSDAEVSVSLVGEEKMSALGKRYMKDKILHNVLSFTEEESSSKFVYPSDGIIRLGEIIVCYPKVFEEAVKEGRSIEQKVHELVIHGATHLLGEHHE